MNIDLISIGDDPPNSVNAIIEVPVGGEPIKYELDKVSGAIFVDRILHTPMRYPANYGFIPHTLGDDGDPVDCLIMSRWPFMPGCVVRARPIAVLFLEDEAGGDEKILAVPEVKTSPYYADVNEGTDLPRSEEHTSELQSRQYLVCRLLLEKKPRQASNHVPHSLQPHVY